MLDVGRGDLVRGSLFTVSRLWRFTPLTGLSESHVGPSLVRFGPLSEGSLLDWTCRGQSELFGGFGGSSSPSRQLNSVKVNWSFNSRVEDALLFVGSGVESAVGQ